jgi:hypothetical protein
LSPTAVRAALIRLVSVDSDTIRPPQTEAIRSSLADDAVAVLYQVDQKIEHLRFDMDSALCAPQFAPSRLISQSRKLSVIPGPGHPAGPTLAAALAFPAAPGSGVRALKSIAA